MLSIVVPLYRSEENIPRLIDELARIAGSAPSPVELVFVDDGSPDRSAELVGAALPGLPAASQLLSLSRNFGAFAAISAGLAHARGDYFAVLAADLQEPPEITLEFLAALQAGADVVFGVRRRRDDPFFSRSASGLFWTLYRHLVNREIPPGGVDVFGCNRVVRDRICSMKEVETSLVALLFWIGFRRAFVPYDRRPRREGRSAWTFSKKLRYLINSVFNFTDLPLRALMGVGFGGMLLAVVAGAVVLAARLLGAIEVPGYTAIVLAILFFGGLTSAGLGIIGQYVWLGLQNTRNRPSYIVASSRTNDRQPPAGADAR